MAYKVVVTRIVNVRQHSNADVLKLGTACGYQVVIGKDTKEGTLGIFFGEGGCLTKEMCKENNLYRHPEFNKDPNAKSGFFEDNRRIKTMKLRGEKSEGFWTTLDVLDWTGADVSILEDGEEFSTLNGKLICEKFHTKATRNAMLRSKQDKGKKIRPLEEVFPNFKKHFKTSRLGVSLNSIPEGAILQISEKCHGTSGRTGYLEEKLSLNKFKEWWNNKFPMKFATRQWEYVSGSRKVVFNPHQNIEDGYYRDTTYRQEIHERIKDMGLQKGETLYYEIVGYTEKGSLIMGQHGISDKALKKEYGKYMAYRYGCKDPKDNIDSPAYKILLYRITRAMPDGKQVVEVPYTQMVTRAAELGIEVVPELKAPFIYNGDKDTLIAICDDLIKGSSVLDNTHIKEGVVVRIEAPNKETFLKHKSFDFCVLENKIKENADYVDTEEIA